MGRDPADHRPPPAFFSQAYHGALVFRGAMLVALRPPWAHLRAACVQRCVAQRYDLVQQGAFEVRCMGESKLTNSPNGYSTEDLPKRRYARDSP